MSDYWLFCEVSEGVFPNECAVVAETAEGKIFSLFVDKNFVKNPDAFGENYIRVQAVKLENDLFHVSLPADPFETVQNIRVKHSQISQIEGKAA